MGNSISISKEEKTAYGILAGILLLAVIAVTTISILLTNKPEEFIPSGRNGSAPEKMFDSSIPIAKETLYLIRAGTGEGREPFWCIPTFYSYRLVNIENGKYGGLSPWSSYPVVADPNVYSPNPDITPDIACKMVIPTIGFQQTLDYTTNIRYNVHRQVGTLNPNAEGEIVGALTFANYSWNVDNKRITYTTQFTDGQNPNSTNGLCSGCA